jgi:2-polyprenyl-6-hydroxyphenyl methylase/3-demethylubiquinone-9 3-methyltransferase
VTLALVPIALQALAMLVDEGHFHRRRGLARWERIGHPLDTLTIAACLTWLLAGGGVAGYVVLAVGSTLFVTKDEPIHAKVCGAGEQWLHAVLFALHPVVLASYAWLAWSGPSRSGPQLSILAGQLAVTVAFAIYQVAYWWPRGAAGEDRPGTVRPGEDRTGTVRIDNRWYADLGERWYHATDTPIALLRAESRHRNPWIAARLGSPKRVLDLGCGAGFLANDLARRGHAVAGVDTTRENLDVARAHDETRSVRYVVADARSLPFASESFDVVCAMDLLEHVEEPERVIAEAARVLAPGGAFVFHTFNRTWRARLIVIEGVRRLCANTPRDLHVAHLFRTPAEVVAICRANRLQIGELRGSRPRFSWPLWRMVLTGRVGNDFAFTWTRSVALGYTGLATKEGLDQVRSGRIRAR